MRSVRYFLVVAIMPLAGCNGCDHKRTDWEFRNSGTGTVECRCVSTTRERDGRFVSPPAPTAECPASTSVVPAPPPVVRQTPQPGLVIPSPPADTLEVEDEEASSPTN